MSTSKFRALTILSDTTTEKPMSCRKFARLMWPDSHMHLKVSNQGNGATRGKAAWLCAGSYLAKLKRSGFVDNFNTKNGYGYYITENGKQLLAST